MSLSNGANVNKKDNNKFHHCIIYAHMLGIYVELLMSYQCRHKRHLDDAYHAGYDGELINPNCRILVVLAQNSSYSAETITLRFRQETILIMPRKYI